MKTFDEVLTLAETMSVEEREDLIHVLQARLREDRRARLAAEIAEANREYAEGKSVEATPEEIGRLIRG